MTKSLKKSLPSIVVDLKTALSLVPKEYQKNLKAEYKLWEGKTPETGFIYDFEEALAFSNNGGQPFPEHLATRLTEQRDSEEYCCILMALVGERYI